MFKKIREFFRVIGELKYIIPLMRYKWPDLEDNASLAHSFQETVQKFGEKEFLYFEDEVWTYKQTNEAANILANKLSNEGIEHGDRVVLFMENRPDFVISLLAINKLGAIGVLINTSLTGKPLVHCINTSDSKNAFLVMSCLTLWKVYSQKSILLNLLIYYGLMTAHQIIVQSGHQILKKILMKHAS